jgi:hypothetical protein
MVTMMTITIMRSTNIHTHRRGLARDRLITVVSTAAITILIRTKTKRCTVHWQVNVMSLQLEVGKQLLN